MQPGDVQDPAWLAIEHACIARIRGGERGAFGELYRAFGRRLYALVLPIVGEPAVAEDVLAATFVTAIERIAQFEARGASIYFWLAGIARSKAIDAHRQAGRAGRAGVRYEALLAPLREGDAPEVRLGGDLDGARLAAAVQRVLAELSPRHRRAIELRMLEERPRAECAEAMGTSLGAFDVLVLRALRSFRASWSKIIGEAEEAG